MNLAWREGSHGGIDQEECEMPSESHESAVTPALFGEALAKLRRGEEAWSEIVRLQERGDEEVYSFAASLLGLSDSIGRELGIMVLRELGDAPMSQGERPFRDATVSLLMEQLLHETEPSVIGWIISALSYHGAGEALPLILPFVHSTDAALRFRVAAALPCLAEVGGNDRLIVDALESLARDEDSDTRYYAISGLEEMVIPAERIKRTLSMLRSDPDHKIQQLVANYLGEPKA